MNGCEKYHDMISQMLDGELTASQKTELLDHIAGCRECEKLYNAFASISLSIEAGLVDPPESLSAGIMDTLRSRNGGKAPAGRPARRWGRFFALAACLAVVIFAGAKTGIFSGASSAAPATQAAGTMKADAAAEACEADYTASEDSGEQYAGVNNETERNVIVTATPFAEAERGQVPEPTGVTEEPTDTDTAAELSSDPGPGEFEMIIQGTDLPETTTSGSSVSLLGISVISVFDGESDEPDPDPIMTVTDETSITLIMDLLEFSEAGDEIDVSGAPVFIFEVERDDGTAYSLSVWIVDGRLCCVSDDDGVLYVAAGDASDLFAFIACA